MRVHYSAHTTCTYVYIQLMESMREHERSWNAHNYWYCGPYQILVLGIYINVHRPTCFMCEDLADYPETRTLAVC